jgi:DNA-binding transcriptional LysR family regulator
MKNYLIMNKDQFDGLLALKVVAEKRNFAAAAAELGISPSAISQTIKLLESRLGVALLSRTTRTTSLTEAGARFLLHAGPAMEQILGALVEVGTYAKKPSGLLRINTLSYAYPFFLAPRIISFTKKFPDVSVEVCLEDDLSDVFERGFDAGVRISDIVAKDLVAIKLFGPIRFVVAAAPKYLNKVGRPSHPKDLLSHNCIRVRVGEKLYDRWEFEQKGKGFQVAVKGSLILNDPVLVAEAALDGAGFVYVTEDVIQEKIEAGKLEIVLYQFAPTSTGYYLYYPQRSQVQPKLRAFIEHLKDQNV